MTTVSQRSFSSGEISPSLHSRVDLVSYANGLRLCKNFFVQRHGGASNRPGTKFIGKTKEDDKIVRLIPFIFNTAQTYMLEFGDTYMRVIRNDQYTTENDKTLAGISPLGAGSGYTFTATAHGFTKDVYVKSPTQYIDEVQNKQFELSGVTANSFGARDVFGVNGENTDLGNYQPNNTTVGEIYELTTPYLEAELMDLNFVQSADVISIVHPNHAPMELSRLADNNWTLTDSILGPNIDAPTNLFVTSGGGGAETYKYKVTAVDAETGEESLPAEGAFAPAITGATQADPCVITVTAHGLDDGDEILIEGVSGMTELNGRYYTVEATTVNTLTLVNTDSTDYAAYSGPGTATFAFYKIAAVAVPTTAAPHVVAWSSVSGALEYNVYQELNGVYGLIGIATGTTFNDEGLVDPNTAYTPPSYRNPFIGDDNYPSAVTYIQQRKAYANTNNDTEKIWLSKIGQFDNFTLSSPIQEDDPVTFNLAGRQVNEVRNMIDLGSFMIMTSGGEWSARGNEAGIITPSSINAKQYSYNGSGQLRPILIDGAALYQQARGSIIRDLSYSVEQDGYSGTDLTLFSNHLFDKYTLVDWAYQQIPNSIVWVVRSDGILLGLTYVKEQRVFAWHQHDVNGFVESIAVIPEGNEDVVYLSVKRTVDGTELRTIEKMVSRQVINVEDNIFMDNAYTYDGTNPYAGATMTVSGGTTWDNTETLTMTCPAGHFATFMVGEEIWLTDSNGDEVRFTITAYTSGSVVSVKSNITVPVAMRSTALSTWKRAKKVFGGLEHLEGEEISIMGDGQVVGSPFNPSYTTYTVSGGRVTVDRPYSLVHFGIPYLSDMETLDIDTTQGESLVDRKKNIGKVTMHVEDSRGIWIGASAPSDDTVDATEGLTELKIRESEGYYDPVALASEPVEVNIRAEWNSNGRVFVRQIDPVPLSVLSIHPSGYIPFRG